MKSGPPGPHFGSAGHVTARVSIWLAVFAMAAAVAGAVALVPASARPAAVTRAVASPAADDMTAAAATLLSQGRPATASSTENATVTPASAAVDGNPGTRWSSSFSDPQWLEVDLGATDTISQVVLSWEAAYARAFQIQTSADGRAWTTIYSTTTGTGGTQTLNVTGTGRYVRVNGTTRATGYGYSLWEFQVYGTAAAVTPMPGMPTPPSFHPNLDPGESVTVSPAVRGIAPDPAFVPPADVTHHEFQTDCSVTRNLPVDPIVFPGVGGTATHMHTFMGATTTDQDSTTGSLSASPTSCVIPQDHSGYWFPTLYRGSTAIMPTGPQVIYYKSGITDYRTVRPFPKGLRLVVGSPVATEAEFQQSPGTVEGWECGNSSHYFDFPPSCPPGSQLNVRYQAPSCWDGVHLDTPHHKSHIAYPILAGNDWVCPASHPVAVPMLEFKMAFPVSGDMSDVHLASGRGYTWHYDFFNAWNPDVLAAMVQHCINGGLQCDTHGYDQYEPQAGAVLGPGYQILPGH